MTRRSGLTAAVALAAAAVLVLLSYLTRPPHAVPLADPDWASPQTTVAGAYHIHSRLSDGSGSLDEIAEAAARAHLQFVIITDHGDGTRLLPPAYRHGVLCIDAVEISTTGGHYVALGMRPSPYPLGGDPRAVVEDVARLGGFGIVAHPTSPKPQLRWTDWALPIDGIEWLNADTQWRAQSRWTLAAALAHYPFGPAAALTAIFRRPTAPLARWDTLAAQRKVVGLAGADAHARLGSQDGDPGREWSFVRLPSYESSFRTFSLHVELGRPLSGDATADAASVLAAIEAGHVYTAIDGLAHPAAFQFQAVSGAQKASEGDDLLLDGGVDLHVRTNDPAGRVVLVRDGHELAAAAGNDVTFHEAAAPGVFRVEVEREGGDAPGAIPWIVSNPIYVRQTPRSSPLPVAPLPESTSAGLVSPRTLDGWSVEHDDASRATLARMVSTPPHDGVALQFALAGGPRGGQYVAIVRNLDADVARFDHLAFDVQASRPLRLFVELRDDAGHRWRRSVYVSTARRTIVLAYRDLSPIEETKGLPDAAHLRRLYFIIDMTNTAPGASGTLRLTDVRLER